MSQHYDFTVIPSDDPDVREADRGFLTEISWTVTAPEGGKSHGVRRVLVPSTADAVVQLGSLYDPPEIPAVTAQRIIEGGTAADPVYIIKIRRDTTAGWAAEDPVLALGERGVDLDTDDERVGDGVTVWSLLPASSHYAADAQGYAADAQGYAAAAGSSESAAAGHAADAQGHADAAALLLADADAIDITIGTVTTVPTGGTATAGITGTAPGKVLNLGIPTGATGAANSLAVGTVTTGAAGSSAAASITGTAPSQTLNLTIPKGDPGGFVTATGVTPGTDLDTVNTPGLYINSNGIGNTVALHWPVDTWAGFIEVIGTTGGHIMQRATSLYSTAPASAVQQNVYERSRVAGVWGPWLRIHLQGAIGSGDLTGTGSPEGVVTAPVGTYYTDTAITNGAMRWAKKTGSGNTGWSVIHGDTGTRNIGSLINAPATATNVLIRRENRMVYVSLQVTFGATPWTAGNVLLTVPAGFRPFYNHNSSPPYSGTGPLSVSTAGAANLWSANANTLTSWSFAYMTGEAWPTTLPGTAG